MTTSVETRLTEARRPFDGRVVVLGVTGGIASYKMVQVARDLTRAGARVEVVLTAGGREFLTPLPFEAVTGRPTHSLAHRPGEPLLHIRLAREADLVVVAPATANFMARARAGMADDLLTAILLATPAPVMLCPAMNDRMYGHPATEENLRALAGYGYRIVGPATGPLAWGEGEGPGRLVDPSVILQHAGRALDSQDLAGRSVVVTAGPTREPIDPVRFLGNRSSGRMGFSLAEAAWRRGARVTLIAGPTHLAPPEVDVMRRVETAEEMAAAVEEALVSADALVMAAAVADFGAAERRERKIKKESDEMETLPLRRTPDVLKETRGARPAGCIVVGFALETNDLEAAAQRKLESKGLDLIVANDARAEGAGFDVETNRVTILSRDGAVDTLPLLTKVEVADRILDRVASRLASTS